MEMKIAATLALAELAREDVPDEVAVGLSRRAPALRPGLHHPGAVRSAAHPRRPDRGGEGGDGVRRRAAPDRRSRGLQGAALRAARSDRRRDAAHHRPRAADAEAGRLRRGRGRAGHPRRLFVRQPGSRLGDPGRARGPGAGGRASRRPRSRRQGHRDPQREAFAPERASTRSSSTTSCSARATCCATASG